MQVNRWDVEFCCFSPLDEGIKHSVLAVMLQRKYTPGVVSVEHEISRWIWDHTLW
jgi:hypothetical protein